MTATDIIEALSGALTSDDRILSVRERELLAALLRRTLNHSGTRENAVTEVIARAVGEVIAERTCEMLGASVAERLLAEARVSENSIAGSRGSFQQASFRTGVYAHSPHPPSPSPGQDKPADRPHPPKPLPPSSPHPPKPAPVPGDSPHPPTPGPRSAADFTGAGAVAARPAIFLSAQCVVLQEFLAPAELQALTSYTLEYEHNFQVSEVISPGVREGSPDFEHRRSRVLMDLGTHQEVIVSRIRSCLPRILRQLGREPFEVSRVEAQITASNDGDYFRWHSDNGHEEIATRELTFVYFFHREPRHFEGGELRIYDSEWNGNRYQPLDNYRVIVPQQNQAVFFASSLAHEISKVTCPSGAFADSRFTVNGWFHR